MHQKQSIPPVSVAFKVWTKEFYQWGHSLVRQIRRSMNIIDAESWSYPVLTWVGKSEPFCFSQYNSSGIGPGHVLRNTRIRRKTSRSGNDGANYPRYSNREDHLLKPVGSYRSNIVRYKRKKAAVNHKEILNAEGDVFQISSSINADTLKWFKSACIVSLHSQRPFIEILCFLQIKKRCVLRHNFAVRNSAQFPYMISSPLVIKNCDVFPKANDSFVGNEFLLPTLAPQVNVSVFAICTYEVSYIPWNLKVMFYCSLNLIPNGTQQSSVHNTHRKQSEQRIVTNVTLSTFFAVSRKWNLYFGKVLWEQGN